MAAPPRGRTDRRMVGAIADRGAWDAESSTYFLMGALRRPRGFARARPFRAKASLVRIAPARSAFLKGLEPPFLSAVGSQGPEPGLDRAFGPLRSDASGLL